VRVWFLLHPEQEVCQIEHRLVAADRR